MCGYLTLRVVSPPRPLLAVAALRRVPAYNYDKPYTQPPTLRVKSRNRYGHWGRPKGEGAYTGLCYLHEIYFLAKQERASALSSVRVSPHTGGRGK
jgi:hypothetical protein